MPKSVISVLGLFLLAVNSTPAFAYIDPGSGSFMLQMLIASLLGAGLTIKMYYRSLKDKISKFFNKNSKDEENDSTSHNENQDTKQNKS